MKKRYLLAAATGIFMLFSASTWAQTHTNDVCSGAMLLTAASDTTCNATPDSLGGANQEMAPGTCSGNTSPAAKDVWYKFAATGTSQNINVNAPRMGMVVEIYGSCGGSMIACGGPQLVKVFGQTFARPGLTAVKASGLTAGTTYYVRVYNYVDSRPVNNTIFTICITTPPAPPVNDLCSGAILLTPAADTTCNATAGSLFGANQESASDSCAGAAKSPSAYDVWYKFTANSNKEVIDITSNTSGLVAGLYNSCGGSLVACANPRTTSFFGNVFAQPGTTSIYANVTNGGTYFVRVYAYGNAAPTSKNAAFAICVHAAPKPPANDSCKKAINITSAADSTCNPTVGTLYGANQESNPDSCSGVNTSPSAYDVWYKFNATATTQVIDVTSQTFGPVAILYSSCGGSPISCANPRVTSFFGNVTARPGTTTITASGLTVGSPYFVRVYAYGKSLPAKNASFTICAHTLPPAPANDSCKNATNVPVGATCIPVNGTLVGANQESAPDSCAGGRKSPTAHDIWYKFTAAQSSQTIEVGSQTVYMVAVLYDACGGNIINCANPPTGVPTGQTRITRIRATGLIAGHVYYVRVYNYGNIQLRNNGDMGICVFNTLPPPANDDCAGAIAIKAAKTQAKCSTLTTANTVGATQSTPFASCAPQSSDDDVWYSFTAVDTTMSIKAKSYTGGITAFGAALYTGACGSLMEDTANCLFSLPDSSITFHNLIPNQSYYLEIYSQGQQFNGDIVFCLYGYGMSGVGIKELSSVANSLAVYPNPAKDQLHVIFNATSSVNVKLINMSGQEIYTESYNSFNGTYNKTIDMINIAKGIYMLQVTTDKETITRKIVRE